MPSPILDALYNGRADEVARLLAANPALDIFEASAAGKASRVAALLDEDPGRLDAFAEDGFFPLALAAFFHRSDVVALLLRRGANPNLVARNAMRIAALHSAVADGGDEASALALIAAGADVEAQQRHGWRAMHGAAMSGMPTAVRALLAAGANAFATNDDGKTALDMAREGGQLETERMLTEGT